MIFQPTTTRLGRASVAVPCWNKKHSFCIKLSRVVGCEVLATLTLLALYARRALATGNWQTCRSMPPPPNNQSSHRARESNPKSGACDPAKVSHTRHLLIDHFACNFVRARGVILPFGHKLGPAPPYLGLLEKNDKFKQSKLLLCACLLLALLSLRV